MGFRCVDWKLNGSSSRRVRFLPCSPRRTLHQILLSARLASQRRQFAPGPRLLRHMGASWSAAGFLLLRSARALQCLWLCSFVRVRHFELDFRAKKYQNVDPNVTKSKRSIQNTNSCGKFCNKSSKAADHNLFFWVDKIAGLNYAIAQNELTAHAGSPATRPRVTK